MARITAIINQKGGVGKTTTALALTDALRARGRRVLLVDFDQQHNATRQYGAATEGVITVYDILCTNGFSQADYEGAVQHTESGNIFAGDPLLAAAETEMASLTCRETRLADVLEYIKDDYDDIIIDCSPTLGIVSTNALVAADSIIVPVIADQFSIDGVKKLADLVGHIASNKRLNPTLHIDGFLVCQYEGWHNLSKDFEEALPQICERYNTKAYKTRIRRCVKVKDAQKDRVSLFEYAPSCTSAKDYEAFCDEYLKEGS